MENQIHTKANCEHNKPVAETTYRYERDLPPIPTSTNFLCDVCGKPYTVVNSIPNSEKAQKVAVKNILVFQSE